MTASLSFICDAHIPPSLAAWLRQRGHDAIALLELDLEQLSDREICEMARERDAIVVTKDSDFLYLRHPQDGPRLLWIRIGNCPRRVLVKAFEKHSERIVTQSTIGDQLVELR
jgi:predicted nuclease of predicted toxin-antitoxin system